MSDSEWKRHQHFPQKLSRSSDFHRTELYYSGPISTQGLDLLSLDYQIVFYPLSPENLKQNILMQFSKI